MSIDFGSRDAMAIEKAISGNSLVGDINTNIKKEKEMDKPAGESYKYYCIRYPVIG